MYEFSKVKIAVSKPVISLVSKPSPVTYIGAGKVKKVGEILEMYSIKNLLVITDRPLMTLGLLTKMLDQIKEKDIGVVIYDGVVPDPSFAIVDSALSLCRESNCDGVLAFGGGSVIDTAKVVAAAATNTRKPRQMEGLFKVKNFPLPFFAVPTTAGTGSEATVAAVISDSDTHRKTQVLDPKIVPMVAILDPEVTIGLPKNTTAFTAMDALTHALEAYVASYATAETDRFCEAAIKLIYKNLLNVYSKPDDIEGREALLVASFYAGMAFTRTYVGYVHAFAHNIGAKYGVPHGLANAVVLPHVMEFYKEVSQARFAHLHDIVGLGSKTDSERVKAERFVKSIFDMNTALAVPDRLEKFNQAAIKEIRIAAFKEAHGTYPVPKYLSRQKADILLSRVAVKA